VIGAGGAGLAAIRALCEAGIDVECLEAGDVVGGHWHTDYDCLHLITPRDSSGYRGDPMPASYPLFPSRDQFLAYLLGHAERFDLVRHVRFGSCVEHVEPRDGRFAVALAGGEVLTYDAVVIANGHLRDPLVPELPGTFTGHQVHSGAYRNAGDVDGTRVLVVGTGNSGCDLASDCAAHLLDVTVSMRHGQLFQPKTFLGKPRGELPIMRLPPRLQDLALRALIRLSVGRPEEYGLPAPATRSVVAQRPVVNTTLLHWIHHGRVRVAPGIRRLDGRVVHFTDGSSSEFDTILWATGFRATLPFLDEALVRRRDDVPLRVAGCTLLQGAPDGLSVVGLCAPRGPQLPVYSDHAALVARMLAVRARRPGAVAAAFAGEEPEHRIDIIRSEWTAQMERAAATVEALDAG
jgi:cation diffusion facilitator CzcD-associated flavoprotein CzcO